MSMNRSRPVVDTENQPHILEWFTSGARYWLDVYDSESLDAVIYRRRLARSIAWFDDLQLPFGAAVLDAGCGAGHLTVALALRGARVVAMDLSPEMTTMARDNASAQGVEALVLRADAQRLPFPDSAFELVVALGLLPWVPSLECAITELARVTAPGGHVLVSFDNRLRLFRLADLRHTPLTQPLRSLMRRFLGRSSSTGYRMVTPRHARAAVAAAGLHVVRTASVGFGPPTFLGRPINDQSLSMLVDAALQRWADRNPALLRTLGAHYLVLAQR